MAEIVFLVEIGNARLKWGSVSDKSFYHGGTVLHMNPQWQTQLSQEWALFPTPTRVVIANVAGEEIAHFLQAWIKTHWQCPVTFLTSARHTLGVTNAYEYPERLGVDRWMNIVAAWQKTRGAVCVVGCGTCITVDVVSAQGMHLGGWIAPDLGLLQRSVIEHTKGCAKAKVEYHPKMVGLGRGTQTGLSHGCLLMAAAFINEAVAKVRAEVGETCVYYLTGGDAEALIPHLQFSHRYEPQLTLQGMAELVSALPEQSS